MPWSRVHVYTVHINPKLAKPYEEAKFIEEGFSVGAFVFSILWTLYHRLWWASFAILVANMIVFQLGGEGSLSEVSKTVMQLGLNIFIGYQANDWWRAKLMRSGFIMTDIVTGDSRLRAEQRFYDHYFASESVA